ncbi:MAG: hypothetical protein HUU06_09440 [Planctomycetaceae bacterium]|nr:hypothetical protein [Planctomycetota bacterium]NUN52991.1 hypothetical protein [Planctomycetaceae bacterium]
MASVEPLLRPERCTVWTGGPCPECGNDGSLLLLRRRADGALLFHCPTCGLAFTQEAGEDGDGLPREGLSLEEVAPGGADAATPEEIGEAGLKERTWPWYEGDLQALLGKRRPVGEEEAPASSRQEKSAEQRMVSLLVAVGIGTLAFSVALFLGALLDFLRE